MDYSGEIREEIRAEEEARHHSTPGRYSGVGNRRRNVETVLLNAKVIKKFWEKVQEKKMDCLRGEYKREGYNSDDMRGAFDLNAAIDINAIDSAAIDSGVIPDDPQPAMNSARFREGVKAYYATQALHRELLNKIYGGSDGNDPNNSLSSSILTNYAPDNRLKNNQFTLWGDLNVDLKNLVSPISNFKVELLDVVIDRLFRAIGVTNKYYAILGVGAGGVEVSSRYLTAYRGWTGVMLDGAFSNARLNYHSEFVSPDNIVDVFKKYNVPREFDLYVCIITGADYVVTRRLLQSRLGGFSRVNGEGHGVNEHENEDNYAKSNSNKLLISKYRPRVICMIHGHTYFFPSHTVPLNVTFVPRTNIKIMQNDRGDSNTDGSVEVHLDTRRATGASVRHLDLAYKDYIASMKGSQKMFAAFGYELVYMGIFVALFVDSRALLETPGEIANLPDNLMPQSLTPQQLSTLEIGRRTLHRHKNNLFTLCHKLQSGSDRTWTTTPLVSELELCRAAEIQGFSQEEIEQRFWPVDRDFTEEELLDEGFVI